MLYPIYNRKIVMQSTIFYYRIEYVNKNECILYIFQI